MLAAVAHSRRAVPHDQRGFRVLILRSNKWGCDEIRLRVVLDLEELGIDHHPCALSCALGCRDPGPIGHIFIPGGRGSMELHIVKRNVRPFVRLVVMECP